MTDASKVTVGKPLIGGAVHVAPTNTTLPTSASATLASAFAELGYMSDAGVVNDGSRESQSINAWGGDEVLNVQTKKNDIWKFTMIEAKNVEVLKQVYGSDNVTSSSSSIAVTVNSKELEPQAWVFDMVLSDGSAKRVVIPNGKITNVGEITYTDSAAVGYSTELRALPDSSGNTHYEYIASAASGSNT